MLAVALVLLEVDSSRLSVLANMVLEVVMVWGSSLTDVDAVDGAVLEPATAEEMEEDVVVVKPRCVPSKLSMLCVITLLVA